MVTALSESELAELRESASISQMSARRLLSDLAHEREVRREGERLLAPFAAEADKLGERDWGVHSVPIQALRDVRAFLAAPKPGGNEKPEAEHT